ncbi:MAG: hypothetical protein KC910_20290, partial [Candidatus Eremiobacteraeota bacterium]|nr:hypothetical protein [Candidatus Eremiobacteraeota bacterium]
MEFQVRKLLQRVGKSRYCYIIKIPQHLASEQFQLEVRPGARSQDDTPERADVAAGATPGLVESKGLCASRSVAVRPRKH